MMSMLRSTPRPTGVAPSRGSKLRMLVGSGDKIGLFALPFIVGGVLLAIAFPSFFDVGGPSSALRAIAIVLLVPGLVIWAWSVELILTKVPRGLLITSGPYALMKHPLYTAVALLVLPAVGLLLNTWVGIPIGLALYVGSRLYAPAEEVELAEHFGSEWEDYCRNVWLPWL